VNHTAPIQPETEATFREGLLQGSLMLPYCAQCSKHHWHPRAMCPFCQTPITQWMPANGKGQIYARTYLPAKTGPGQAIAYVQLAENVTVLARLVGERAAEAEIGQQVVLDEESTRTEKACAFRLCPLES
jgi:uncharacterized OB-fold protein